MAPEQMTQLLKRRTSARTAAIVAAALLLAACASQPPLEFSVEVPPGVRDARGRFAEVYCRVLEEHGPALPDYRPCQEALSPVVPHPVGTGRPVDLGPSQLRLVVAAVPGIGYACVSKWLQDTGHELAHIRRFGYEMSMVEVDALSGTAANAARIRDALLALPDDAGPPRVVLMGYSKGTPDILEAIVRYPEIRRRIAAVISVAGAVRGSPVAEHASESEADLMRFFPGADCDAGDNAAVASLHPDLRNAWLAANPLPADLRYYSVVTLPGQARVSRALVPTYHTLAKVDPRNDGQVIYSDQIVPGSVLLGFVNADHWAVALPIDRSHAVIGGLFVNHNDYPREAMLEAVLRFVEEDITLSRTGGTPVSQGHEADASTKH
jgi:pimeloyl-ACP methyl ester carboxylesterase